MRKVRYKPRAKRELRKIWQSISIHNEAAADALLYRIRDRLRSAAHSPLMFAARPEIAPTARMFVDGPYLIIYEPSDDGILVIAIVHGKRDPDSWLG